MSTYELDGIFSRTALDHDTEMRLESLISDLDADREEVIKSIRRIAKQL